MFYRAVLEDSIRKEIEGTDYFCSKHDRQILDEMLAEVNQMLSRNYHYLAEIDTFNIVGSGYIFAKYISRFESESVRCFLISQLVADKVENCSRIIMDLYYHFRESKEYISAPGEPAPAHIYVRYDNALRTLKPKLLKEELLELACSPRDAFYLPFTMRMLASWKIPELKESLISYVNSECITAQAFGINETETFYPSADCMRRELKFLGLAALKYYPSNDVISVIKPYLQSPDNDIQAVAKKTMEKLLS